MRLRVRVHELRGIALLVTLVVIQSIVWYEITTLKSKDKAFHYCSYPLLAILKVHEGSGILKLRTVHAPVQQREKFSEI